MTNVVRPFKEKPVRPFTMIRGVRGIVPIVAIAAWMNMALVCAAAPISSRNLIAAMPPETESVLVWRFDRLAVDDSVLKDETQNQIEHMMDGNEEDAEGLDSLVWGHAARSGLLTQAIGGSNFGPPPESTGGIGAGSMTDIAIYVVERPLEGLRKDLETRALGGKMKKHLSGNDSVYEGQTYSPYLSKEGEPPVHEPRFIAMFDDRTVVVTERLNDIEHMLSRLRANASDPPPQWQAIAAHVDMDAPILVLRRYNPANSQDPLSPVNPRLPEKQRISIDGYGVCLPSATELKFNVYCETQQPDKASAFLPMIFNMPPGGWEISPEPLGFSASVVVQLKDRRAYILLRMLPIFGRYIAI